MNNNRRARISSPLSLIPKNSALGAFILVSICYSCILFYPSETMVILEARDFKVEAAVVQNTIEATCTSNVCRDTASIVMNNMHLNVDPCDVNYILP